MKKILTLVCAALAALVLGCAVASAQAKIETKKYKISDLPNKTVKVVLTGNSFMDGLLREEVRRVWTLSPYEYCTESDFDGLRTSSDYYFLRVVSDLFENGDGIDMLTLLKGGTGEKLSDMLEVATMPLCASEDASGREAVYFGILLETLQKQAERAMDSDIRGYMGIPPTLWMGSAVKGKTLLFAQCDLAMSVTEVDRKKIFTENTFVLDEDEVDERFVAGEDVLVSYCVAPKDAGNGSWCFKMVFNAATRELVYFRRHRIASSRPSGFLVKDVRKIVSAQ